MGAGATKLKGGGREFREKQLELGGYFGGDSQV